VADHGIFPESGVAVRHPPPGLPLPLALQRRMRAIRAPREFTKPRVSSEFELRDRLLETASLVLSEPRQDSRTSLLALLESRMRSSF
jgi:hypothetical protein